MKLQGFSKKEESLLLRATWHEYTIEDRYKLNGNAYYKFIMDNKYKVKFSEILPINNSIMLCHIFSQQK